MAVTGETVFPMMVTGMRDSVPAKARQQTMITHCFNWGNHAMALQTQITNTVALIIDIYIRR